ncbi:hypothetical protein DMA11_13555 [Marinilabiliaceae bacterium JC017]|nr:hypothetical protein DMA11_13555 [Marinilabiliaceae bacterium JC017]
MKRLLQLFIFTVTLLSLTIFFSACQPAKEKPTAKHYVWMGEGQNHSTDFLTEIFSKLKDAGISGVMYQCPVDNYEQAVTIAHQNGLELHAWQTIMRHPEKELLKNHPDWFTVSRDGKSTATNPPYVDYYKWLCPTNKEVRNYLVNFVEKLASIKGLDGVHLDYIRHSDVILPIELWEKYDLVMDKEYPEFDFCYCDECCKRFEKETGIDPRTLKDTAPDNEAWRKFRYKTVTEVVDLLTEAVHKKGIKITAAVFPTPTISKTLVRQAWDKWSLDAYYPMNYNSFYEEKPQWVEKACVEGVQAVGDKAELYSGLFVPALTPDEFRVAIKASKKGGANGICIFTPYNMNDDHWAVLKEEIAQWDKQ